MRVHLARNPPFAFFAQLDLAEAAGLGSVASGLPPAGRLLFFYDLAVGPWESGTRVCRVIHDVASPDMLRRASMPPDLAAADADWRSALSEACAARGLTPTAADAGTPYLIAEQAMRLRETYQLPAPHSLDASALAGLPTGAPSGMSKGEMELYFAYCEFLEMEEPANLHLLLGLSTPIQDDPRFDAASLTLFGLQHAPRDGGPAQWERIVAEASAWRLLLQFDVADTLGEGAVYFLIRSADLAAQSFDRVVAVYQQS